MTASSAALAAALLPLAAAASVAAFTDRAVANNAGGSPNNAPTANEIAIAAPGADDSIMVWARGSDNTRPSPIADPSTFAGTLLQDGDAVELNQYFLIVYPDAGLGSVSIQGHGMLGESITTPGRLVVYLRSGGHAGADANRVGTVTDVSVEHTFFVEFRLGDVNGALTTLSFPLVDSPGPGLALVSNTANAVDGSLLDINRQVRYGQRFTAGGHDFGYQIDEVHIRIESIGDVAFPPSVQLWTVNRPLEPNPGRPSQKIYDLIPPDTVQTGALNAYTAPPGTVLNERTAYILLLAENGANVQFGSTTQGGENGLAGFVMNDGAMSKPLTGPWSDDDDVLIMSIFGLANLSLPDIQFRDPDDLRLHVDTPFSTDELPHPSGGAPPYTWSLSTPPAGSGIRISTSTTPFLDGRPVQADLDASPITWTYTVADSQTPPAELSKTFTINVTPARTTLLGNTSQTRSDSTLVVDDDQSHSQAFTTGSHANGYGLLDIGIWDARASGVPLEAPKVELWTATAAGLPDTKIYDLARPGIIHRDTTNEYAAPLDAVLHPNATYAIVISQEGGPSYTSHVPSNTPNDGSADGFSIANQRGHRQSANGPFVLTAASIMAFTVVGYPRTTPIASPPAHPPPTAPPTPPPADPAPTNPPTNPAPTDPAPTDPPTNPVPTDPPTNPVPTDPPTDPVPTDPPTNPVPTDPAPTNPVPTDPAPTDPAPPNPAPTDPGPTNPAPTNPAPTNPGPTIPVAPPPVPPPVRTLGVSETSITVAEAREATYSLALGSQPTGDVTVTPASADATVATVAPETLAFTRSNWDTPQTVTVSGVNDGIINANARATTIGHNAVGGGYNLTLANRIAVTVTDYVSGVGIEGAEADELPADVALFQNYPNPFNPRTTIEYALPQAGAARLVVYDMLGREAAVLHDGPKPAGRHVARFDASRLPNGAYVYRLTAGGKTLTRTMALAK